MFQTEKRRLDKVSMKVEGEKRERLEIMNYVNRKVIKGIIHKKCSCCHTYVPEAEFHIEYKRFDGRQAYCKKCKKEYMDDYYRKKRGTHNMIY